MPPNDDLHDWLGDLKWMGYPRLAPVRDVAADAAPDSPAPRPRKTGDIRAETAARENAALIRENEAQKAKIESFAGLIAEFERRLSEASAAYEGAALDTDNARRAAELENARLTGELESARAEVARREARELSRESDLTLERERRADSERALLESRRRANDLEFELTAARSKAAELAGSIVELRRQASAAHERLLQAKALTDQDVSLLRSEMRDFLAKFHRQIQDTYGPMSPGETQ